MQKIKTRQSARNIKAIDKSAVAAEHLKTAFVRTKQQVEDLSDDGMVTPDEYAQQYIEDATGSAAKQTKQILSTEFDTLRHRIAHHRQSVRAAQNSERTIKQIARKTGKRTVKTVQKTVKTAANTVKTAQKASKTTIKTAEATAKTVQKTAQTTTKTARATAEAAKVTARAAAVVTKYVVKAVSVAVKAIIAGMKSLVATIAAGGWIAVIVIVLVCMIGILLCGCFGIFFSWDDLGTGLTTQSAVQQINNEYLTRLEEAKTSASYDELEMIGTRASWPEVLSIYAVMTTTDPEQPQDVVTMTEDKQLILSGIFWRMNEISTSTSTKRTIQIVDSVDEEGNVIKETVVKITTILHVSIIHKTAEEMAQELHFNESQMEQLQALKEPENAQLWSAVLYGVYGSDEQIVAVALSQVGNVGGQPYWSWYGFNSRVAWCACFVSWCANECGYLDMGIIPKFAGCGAGSNWFKERGQWLDNSAEPTPGMIIFFDWKNDYDGRPDHVGIVERVENGRVYTIEGNSGDACRQRSYPLGHFEIYGYGVAAF